MRATDVPDADAPDADVPDVPDTTDEEADEEARAPSSRRRRRTRWILPLLSAGLLVAGTVLTVLTANLNDSPAAENKALTDTAATDRVSGDIRTALGRIFTYSPDSLAATERDAKTLLRGTAAKEYEALLARVRQRVADQELSLTTQVVRIGVTRLAGDTAQLLAFLDQTTRRDGEKPAATAAQLSVTAELDGGHWRITRIKAR